MKKLIYNKYGGVEVLEITDIPIPEIDSTTLLVKVKAVSINPLDWKIWQGEMKLMSGSKFPKGVGMDFSGVVEKTGSSINKYKKGDAVFGTMDLFKGGALAEYIAITEKNIAIKPNNISFEQAAAMPIVGSAALQIMDKLLNLKQGTELLINGASGGIGMFVTQIAKMKGAIVTSVVNEKAIEQVKEWGSDFAINYEKEAILKSEKKYDAVIDLSGKVTFDKAKAIMKRVSVYVNTIPGPKEIISSFLHNLFSSQKYKVLILKPSLSYLQTLSKYASKNMEIVIGKRFPFNSFKEAYTEVQKGGFSGKAIFIVG